MSWRDAGHDVQGFLNGGEGWVVVEEIGNSDGEEFLPGEGKLRRYDFGDSNLFQS